MTKNKMDMFKIFDEVGDKLQEEKLIENYEITQNPKGEIELKFNQIENLDKK
jgi:hypothetical protein